MTSRGVEPSPGVVHGAGPATAGGDGVHGHRNASQAAPGPNWEYFTWACADFGAGRVDTFRSAPVGTGAA
ncbi:hypothetical protein GCM10017744_088420 [Streptomyces antimycoticus]|uniref:Uncharacterized protein n=1 Tax=Streptomyces antimycoticus TaxID=68175 RepID=A0A4D4KQ56_9ACTN|nr:hypothetical protein [Streptomyces antimycoticus]GDY49036.1 hypothetical protein SANT12839_099180 [Streptomyces antimycoticus]